MHNLSFLKTNSQPFAVDSLLPYNHKFHSKYNFDIFLSLPQTKSYTPIAGCVLEHILANSNLTDHEKLYYILADSLALISKNKGNNRVVALASTDWAERLGCSRSLVFIMQQSLVQKGYFIIDKDFDKKGRNKRNLITPTLPSAVFNYLNNKFPNKAEAYSLYNPVTECKRSYLDKTKLFIKLNYNLLKIIISNKYLNPKQKVIWLSFYIRGYKNYMLQTRESITASKYNLSDESIYNVFSFVSSYKEIAAVHSCDTKYLSKSIRTLEALGFIKSENFYIRNKYSNNFDDSNYSGSDYVQERQDKSLWKITIGLPEHFLLELDRLENRSNLTIQDKQDKQDTLIDDTLNSKLTDNCLILDGIKVHLDLEQISLIKAALVVDSDDIINKASADYQSSIKFSSHKCTEYKTGIPNNISGSKEKVSFADIPFKNLTPKPVDNNEGKNSGIKSAPHVAKSGLLLNKDFLSEIKDIKSNLGDEHKVLFDQFLTKFNNEGDKNINIKNNYKNNKQKEFNIYSELIRKKIKILPKDKADKARKFAYTLVSKDLTKGYASSLSKHELAKQLIYHAATWKPTKLGTNLSREKEIDAALSVAWKAIVSGTWTIPLELAKAEILQCEFKHYKRKYRESGILSHEAKALELDVNNMLGGWYDLIGEITRGTKGIDHRSIEVATTQQDSSKYYDINQTQNNLINEQSTYLTDDKEVENEQCNKLYVDLSHIPDEQKYLKVVSNDKDYILKLETSGSNEYFVKLKELYMNEEREWVITLSHVANDTFLKLSNEINLLNQSDIPIEQDLMISNAEDQQEIIIQKKPKQNGFSELDRTLFNSLKQIDSS
jgi:hypothetical protein